MELKTYNELKNCFYIIEDCMGQLDYITDVAGDYDGCHDLEREFSKNIDVIRKQAEKMVQILKK